jgi:fatty-acyl-CoA synthase
LARPLTYWTIDAEGDLPDNCRALDLKSPRLAPERPSNAKRAGLTAKEVALYIYTSGTTGMPKAARITHMRAQLYMRAFAGATGGNAEDKVYCALPLYHSTGGLCGVGAALLNGGTLVLRRKFSASHFWDDIADQDCTIFVYIGELCRYLVNQPPHPKERAHHLRLAFGNGMRPEVWTEFQTRFGVPEILEFYGSTEGNVSMFNFDGQPGAIGRVPPYLRSRFSVKLVRFDVEAEAPVRGPDGLCIESALGEVGEAVGLIGADARSNYTGYADKAASDRKVLRDVFEKGDAWFRTGDLMRQDADGYFYFVDRIGDTFRWKGENVSTTEVAEAVSRYPGVAEANVYGVSVGKLDGRAGMVSITAGNGFDLQGLRAFLRQELPGYARPIFVRIDPAIDTTGTFKYRKLDLVRDGFDPSRIEHAVYFDDPVEQRYAQITPALYARIQNGEFRL